MKKYTLTKTDQQLIHIFKQIGMPQNIAKTLAYLSKVEKCRAADIELSTRLRQPEVSTAIKQLKKLGVIKTNRLKKDNESEKGRPPDQYQLTKDVDTVVNHYKEQKQEEIDNFKQAIKDYKKLSSQKKKYSS